MTRVSFCRWLVAVVLAVVSACIVGPAQAQTTAEAFTAKIVPAVGHSGTITFIAFAPDGRTVLSGGSELNLWDVASGRLLRTFQGHSDSVNSVAFAADGRTALSGSSDKTLKLWDISSGRLLRTFQGQEAVNSVAFAPDGRTALSGTYDGTQKLWDVATGQVLRTYEKPPHRSIVTFTFAPDLRTALLWKWEDKSLGLWDVGAGRLLRTFKGPSESAGFTGKAAFAPDGRTALSGSQDKTLKLWDASSGRLLRSFEGHLDFVTSAAFAPDGRTALSGSADKTLKLWDIASGRLLRTFEGHSSAVWSVAFAPDGRAALSGGADKTLKLWDLVTGRLLRTFEGHSSLVYSVTFAPDGRTALWGSEDGTLKLWDVVSGRLLRTFEGHSSLVFSVAFAPNGHTALSGGFDKTLKLWDVASGRLLRSFKGHSNWVKSVAFAPDGRTALSGSEDKTLRLWDVASGPLRTFEGPSDEVYSVAFAPDGRMALSGGSERTLKLWDVASGRLVRTFLRHSSLFFSVAFAPDGRTALSGSGKALELWDVASGRLLRSFEGHSHWVQSVAFAPDGRTALSGSRDTTVKLWDVASGRLLRSFEGDSGGEVHSVAFAPDGHVAGSGSKDATLRLWNVATGELLASLIQLDEGEWVTITPEGFFEASEQGAKHLTVVRGLEAYSIDQFYDALHRPDLVREKLAGDPRGKVKEAAAKLDLTKALGSGAAPKVVIMAPQGSGGIAGVTKVSSDRVEVEASIADQGGGIGKVEWRVNGVTLGLDARGFDRLSAASVTAASSPSGTIIIKHTLPLTVGENRIEVVAYNAKGLMESNPAVLTVVREGPRIAVQPRLHVLAVGVDAYDDSALRLAYAVSDARSIGDALRRAGGKLYSEISVTTVLDADVTIENLDKVFAKLSNQVQPEDVFVFFVAGHGKTVEGRYYFLPRDFRYDGEASIVRAGVGQDRWQDWFRRIPAQKSILLYDTCDSGTLTSERIASRGLEEKTAIDLLTRATGRTTLTAATANAPALEGYHGHGVFTYALLEAIEQADTNGDGLIDMNELIGHVDRAVPAISERAFKMQQFPQKAVFGSNFPFANKLAVLGTALGGAASPPISSKPTHVVIAPAEVFEAAAGAGVLVEKLAPGTLVTLVKTEQGWVLVARDGRPLGYVAAASVAAMQ